MKASVLRLSAFVVILSLFVGPGICNLWAVDITTTNGRTFRNVHDVVIRGDLVSFSTDTEIVKLKVNELTAEDRSLYAARQKGAAAKTQGSLAPATAEDGSGSWKTRAQVQQLEMAVVKGIQKMRQPDLITTTYGSAFHLADLEKAKAKAVSEGKLLGFIMEWDSFFGVPSNPQAQGGSGAIAHFQGVFNDALVLIFVRHEAELQQVPDAVKAGFFGPEEGGFAPNMAVTDATAADFVCEIPLGGNYSIGPIREKLFLVGTNKMIAYLRANDGKTK